MKMLPSARGQQQGATMQPLVDVSEACAIFEAAFAGGGAEATLALVERDLFYHATRIALDSTGRSGEIDIAISEDGGCGIAYTRAGSGGIQDIFGATWAGNIFSAEGRMDWLLSTCWVHGSLWWLRHYTGAFLAEKIRLQITIPDVGSNSERLISWLRERVRGGGDFSNIASLHGAMFHTMIYQLRDEPGYPSYLAREVWCPWTDSGGANYECRHAIGHGIF